MKRFCTALLLVLSLPAFADGPRLIQTAPGVRRWMNESEISELSRSAHLAGHCGGYMDVTIEPDRQPQPIAGLNEPIKPIPNQIATVAPMLREIAPQNLTATIARLMKFSTRHADTQTGVQAAHWIRDQFVLLANGRSDVTVSLFKNMGLRQPSVIARIEGSGALAKEVVILGAHEDTINHTQGGSKTGQAPGADDDASGIATLLEAFRIIAQSNHRPERSIEFIAYAGEELGLIGSRIIAMKYNDEKRIVRGVLQLDMTMYPGKTKKLHFITDYTNQKLTRFSQMLMDTYVKQPWSTSSCGYACSDHASWHDWKYPAVFPFETFMNGHNRAIHTPGDTLKLLDVEFGAHFAKLAIGFAVEMAND